MSTTESKASNYHFEVLPQKENVFVTQLNDRTDSDNIRRFEVVKDSADQLLRSGINTLQSTSLLRQAVETEHVDHELEEKRQEFRKRMEKCKEKQEALALRQNQIKERVSKFDRFLKENEAKRVRALEKYQHEHHGNALRSKEILRMNVQLENLKKQRSQLVGRLAKYKIYEKYMTGVADIFPGSYADSSFDSVLGTIIQRHEGLSATNAALLKRNQKILSSIEVGQRQLDDLKHQRIKQKLVSSSELALLQAKKEKLLSRNKFDEQRVGNAHRKKRSVLEKLAQIVMGIDNLAQQSHRRHWPPFHSMSYIQKLSMIQEYLLERAAVQKYILDILGDTAITHGEGTRPAMLPPIHTQHGNTVTLEPSRGKASRNK